MKLSEIAKKIDKSSNNEEWIDLSEIGNELNVVMDHKEQNRLKSYWVGNWYCTDTYVGYKLYFLDDKPVCFSIQKGRKSDEKFHWFSKDIALEVRNYLLSLMSETEEDLSLNICSIEDDIGDSYKIHYNSQILSQNKEKAMYEEKPIKILKRIRETPDHGIDTQLEIQLENNETKIVDINDIRFKFNLDK